MHATHNPPERHARDGRRFPWSGRPYCAICGATSGQPHDPAKHAEQLTEAIDPVARDQFLRSFGQLRHSSGRFHA